MITRKLLLSLVLITLGTLSLFLYDLLPVLSKAPEKPPDTLIPVNGIPILMYHKVGPDSWGNGPGLRVTPEQFDKQLEYLKETGYNTVSLDQVIHHWDTGVPLPKHPIVLTFDDGYEDNFIYAFPILKKFGYTATIFLVYDEINGYNRWDVEEHNTRRFKLLSMDQIRIMQDYGISFESHTLSHPHLTTLDNEKANEEIRLSKTNLEKVLGRPVNYIAYPYGQHSDQICEITRRAGYKAAISTIRGVCEKSTDRYRLKRLRVNGYLDMDRFKVMLGDRD